MVNVAEQRLLRIPPIRHFADNRCVKESGASTAGIVGLVEDEVEIATGTVDVVEQKVCGNCVVLATPLGKQFGEQRCGKGIAHTPTKNAGIECFRRKGDTIKF